MKNGVKNIKAKTYNSTRTVAKFLPAFWPTVIPETNGLGAHEVVSDFCHEQKNIMTLLAYMR